MMLRNISFSIKLLYKSKFSDVNKFFDKLSYVKCFIISEKRYFIHLNFRIFTTEIQRLIELWKFVKQVQGGDKSDISLSRSVKKVLDLLKKWDNDLSRIFLLENWQMSV